ncbi:acyl-CoA dehydrogenase family protein [Pelotomaculum propionicicum]|uniref:Putative acyl-CoA dehydrogenase fadE25 n=1 Tax=Pelotomaculum propionicicum TaxID=258475 RepID=A0A4Y7RK52_9FIRM|nr:acyl-CoA dehydrogenase family protein [Pelotomaculum propionicicum]TEB09109.1 putative acyl-CoA dehydrogenase fadE25 [Pelotomaculum propionicicum]
MANYLLINDEQADLLNSIKEILHKELAPYVKEYDQKGEFPMHVLKKLNEAGFHSLNLPTRYGGLGIDKVTECLVMEEFAKVDAGFAFSYLTSGILFGFYEYNPDVSEELRAYAADRLINGDITAFALTESDAGSDAAAIKTTAKKVGDEYILNGTKCFITNGGIADFYTVAAVTDKTKGTNGISLFLVEKDRGVQCGKEEEKMGLRLSNTVELIFDDVKIPAANLLGRENYGFKYVMHEMNLARPVNMAFAVGIAQAALDYAVKYAKERVTFDKPIIQHQGVGFMLADMEMLTQAARSMVLYAAMAIDKGLPLGTLSSTTKTFASEACMKVTTDAVQVLGGYGYMKDYPVEKLMRDAKIFSIFEGTNQIQRMVTSNILARSK